MLAGHFPQILALHIACVTLSGTLFFLRGVLRLREKPLANHVALRRLSWLIDSALLAAGVALAASLRQFPFVNGWLTAKLLLLVVYIGLGTLALRRARSRGGRLAAFMCAIAVYLSIVAVAVRHVHS